MKKIITLVLFLFTLVGFSFAQSEASALPEDELQVDLTKETIVPEEQHLVEGDKSGKVVIEYTPMVEEVRVTYTCMYNLYEQGNAIAAIRDCLSDFIKDRNYYNYKYMEKDRERYFKDDRNVKRAQYTVHVKLVR